MTAMIMHKPNKREPCNRFCQSHSMVWRAGKWTRRLHFGLTVLTMAGDGNRPEQGEGWWSRLLLAALVTLSAVTLTGCDGQLLPVLNTACVLTRNVVAEPGGDKCSKCIIAQVHTSVCVATLFCPSL